MWRQQNIGSGTYLEYGVIPTPSKTAQTAANGQRGASASASAPAPAGQCPSAPPTSEVWCGSTRAPLREGTALGLLLFDFHPALTDCGTSPRPYINKVRLPSTHATQSLSCLSTLSILFLSVPTLSASYISQSHIQFSFITFIRFIPQHATQAQHSSPSRHNASQEDRRCSQGQVLGQPCHLPGLFCSFPRTTISSTDALTRFPGHDHCRHH